MPTCQNCNQRWRWKQTVKKSFTLDTGMKCPHCGEKQYPTSKSRKRSGLCTFILPLTLLLPIVFDISALAGLGILLGCGILLIGIYPLMIELSDQDESLR
ncbi:TIGR04104 family putative zinc finger protein [Virgibacillus oceani]|uniref:TIGR04104 family putative zinc finger protein n=1 Tax=Virgibacillus oceani TaxID=1479511 RepID=UPI00166706E2|nr:TIGR04104 family putative zinc finger protein [Virgibacillus oceani]